MITCIIISISSIIVYDYFRVYRSVVNKFTLELERIELKAESLNIDNLKRIEQVKKSFESLHGKMQ